MLSRSLLLNNGGVPLQLKKMAFNTSTLEHLCGNFSRGKITIINYHDPSAKIFETHIQNFSRHYTFISIDAILRAIEQKAIRALPPNPLLVTLDDGHVGNTRLFPILRKYRVPAVMYVTAGLIGTNRHFWFDALPRYGGAMRRLKMMPDPMRRAVLWDSYNHWDEKEYDNPAAMSREELKDFVSLGGTVGSHTMFHPILARCEEQTGLWECRASRRILEEITGEPVVHFALPNGDGNPTVLQWIKGAGYQSCRTIQPGWVTEKTSPFALPNFGISDKAGCHKAALQACGFWDLVKTLSCRNRDA